MQFIADIGKGPTAIIQLSLRLALYRTVLLVLLVPIGIYEVLDYHTEETFPNLMEAVSYFKGGLALYRKQRWDRAVEAFESSLVIQPNDKLVQMYIERCNHLKADPPGENWDGVWIMKSK